MKTLGRQETCCTLKERVEVEEEGGREMSTRRGRAGFVGSEVEGRSGGRGEKERCRLEREVSR
jgi:hypothetical protein